MLILLLDRENGDWPSKSSREMLPLLAQEYDWGNVSFSHQVKPLLQKGYCSVSHSRHRMIVAVSDHPIGIDIEYKRELRMDLMKRLRLNPKSPLEDWCLREAWIKLDDDPSHLTKALPLSLFTQTIDIGEEWLCKLVSRTEFDPITIQKRVIKKES